MQSYSQPCSHSSLGDFSASTACAVTAAMEMSQPYSHCSYAAPLALEISQPPQPIQPLQQWRCLSRAHAPCACSHAATLALEISQPPQPMQPLQQWRCLSHAHALCHCSHTAMQLCSYTVIAALKISQPS